LRERLRGELNRLLRSLGITTIYVTHDQAEAMTLAHRVAVMHQGKLQQFDTPLTIYDFPANRFVAEFVGNPGMNFINGRIDAAARSFTSDKLSLELDPKQLEKLKGVTPDQQITLGIRPEHVHVAISESPGWLPASVYVTELMGSETFVFLNLGDNRIIARAASEFRAEVETTVWISFDMNRVHFFGGDGKRL